MLVKLQQPPTLGSINELICGKKAGYVTTEIGLTFKFSPDFTLSPLAFEGRKKYSVSGTIYDSVSGIESRAVLTIDALHYRGTRHASIRIIED